MLPSGVSDFSPDIWCPTPRLDGATTWTSSCPRAVSGMLRREGATAVWQPAIWARSSAADPANLRIIQTCIDRWVAYRDDHGQRALREAMRTIIGPQGGHVVQPLISRTIETLLEAFEPETTIDLIPSLAEPLPAHLITTLLGCPDPTTRQALPGWSDAIQTFLASDRDRSPSQTKAAAAAIAGMNRVLSSTVESGSAGPLLQALLDGVSPDSYEREDALANAALLMFAGFETTSRLLGRVLRILVNLSPDHRPHTEAQADYLVRWTLRHQPPVRQLARRVITGMESHGCPMQSGDMLHLRLDGTSATSPEFLAFGGGRHACPGGTVGTFEAVRTVLALMTTFEGLRADGTPDERSGRIVSLPIRFARRQ